MDKLWKKLTIVMLVMTLLSANLSIIGMYGIAYALTETELSAQTTKTENANVEFNAYLEGGIHSKNESIDTNTAKILVNIKVKDVGYLKNGEISFHNTNFNISDKVQNDVIQSIEKANNKIALKQVNSGSDVTIEIPIEWAISDTVAIDYFESANEN